MTKHTIYLLPDGAKSLEAKEYKDVGTFIQYYRDGKCCETVIVPWTSILYIVTT